MVLVSIYSSHQSVLFVALRELTASAKMADSERADTIPLAEINTQEYATPASQTVDSVPPLDKITLLRLICSGYSFFCAGVNDGSLGPLIPYLLSTYDLNTNRVSIV
jgi:fucose permease